MMLNSDSPLWEDSNKLNLVKIGPLGVEKSAIKDQHANPSMANFSIPSNLIFTRFSLLESSQRGESEFNIII